jgi:3-hydroxybutyryl-CoA dehydratase
MRVIENITYDELHVEDYATFTKTLTEDELVLFAAASGDVNPVSLDAEYAKKTIYKERIGYGMWASSLISAALSTVIPGPGTVHLEQNLKFNGAVRLGDTLTVTLTVNEKLERHRVTMDCTVKNQDNIQILTGTSLIVAPTEKVSLQEPNLPRIEIES